MKSPLSNPLLLIVLTLFTGLLSCKKGDHMKQFDRIEQMMFVMPDSALTLLDAIPSVGLSDEEDARRRVLLSLANFKNNTEILSDSIIAPAVKFYEPRTKDRNRAWAYFAQAIVMMDTNRYADAIIALLNGEITANEFNDHLALGLIYRALGDSFSVLNDYKSSIYYYDKSLEEFNNINSKDLINQANHEQINAQNLAQNYQKTAERSTNTLHILLNDSISSRYYEALCLRRLAELDFISGNYDQSMDRLDSLFCKYPDCISDYSIIIYNMSCVRTGQFERIKLDSEIQSIINEYSDSNKIDISLTREEFAKFESLYEAILIENASIPRTKHFNSAIKNKEQVHQQAVIKLLRIIGVSIFIIVILIIYMLLKRKLYKKDRDNYLLTIRHLESEISNSQIVFPSDSTDKAEIRQEFEQLLADRFNMLDHLCSTYFTINGEREKKRIYDEVASIVTAMSSPGEFMSTIEAAIDRYRNSLLARLKNEIPDLKERDYQLFIFITIGLSPQTISVLQGISVENVYTRKSNLKKKIAASTAPSKEDFLSVYKITQSKTFI